MQRRIVIAEFFINGEMLNVVLVHLGSYRSSGEVRVAQLHAIFQLLKEASHSLIMGDFNFHSSWPRMIFWILPTMIPGIISGQMILVISKILTSIT